MKRKEERKTEERKREFEAIKEKIMEEKIGEGRDEWRKGKKSGAGRSFRFSLKGNFLCKKVRPISCAECDQSPVSATNLLLLEIKMK